MGLRLPAMLLALALLGAACSGGTEIASRSLPAGTDAEVGVEGPARAGGAATGEPASPETGDGRTTAADQSTGDPEPGDPSVESADAGPRGDAADAAPAAGLPVGDPTGPGTPFAGPPVILVPVEPGDSGDDVTALQERLAELGFTPGTPDGSYGRRTTAAVEAFQLVSDLEITGTADAETVSALVAYRYDGLRLRAGDEGTAVEELQRRLADGPFDPGSTDGEYGRKTVEAVWALEKLAGVPVDGDWGPLDEHAWDRLMAGEIGGPERSHDQRWVEVDLSEQLVKVYDPGSAAPTLISHASSGSGIPWRNEEHSGSSITPLGDFHITRRISGWRESSLDIGRLYNPLYFNGGIALHGSLSVPLHPASHGCVRLPMHVAEYLPGELPDGTPVHVVA